jgi:hypothetical protein
MWVEDMGSLMREIIVRREDWKGDVKKEWFEEV